MLKFSYELEHSGELVSFACAFVCTVDICGMDPSFRVPQLPFCCAMGRLHIVPLYSYGRHFVFAKQASVMTVFLQV